KAKNGCSKIFFFILHYNYFIFYSARRARSHRQQPKKRRKRRNKRDKRLTWATLRPIQKRRDVR
ncbi:Hypothetical protein FKW44_021614, partial [Caligus rogercresseyi]